MASTNKTGNLRLSQFEAADKPSWLSDYNNDMQAIDEAVAAAGQQAEASMQKEVYDPEGKAQDVFAYAREGGIFSYEYQKAGNVHMLTGGGKHPVFTAAADYETADVVLVNGQELELLDSDGKAAEAAWKAGDEVFLLRSGEQARVMTPLANKANRDEVQDVGGWLTGKLPGASGTGNISYKYNKVLKLLILTGTSDTSAAKNWAVGYVAFDLSSIPGLPVPKEPVTLHASGFVFNGNTTCTTRMLINPDGRCVLTGVYGTNARNLDVNATLYVGDWNL